MKKNLSRVITTVLLVLAISGLAMAGTTGMTERVRSAIDSALAVLNDPALMGPSHTKERRKRVRSVVEGAIDFEEIAKRSLGVHWRKRTPVERREFIRLFSNLLEASYMDKIEANYDAKVLYKGEKMNGKGTRGVVKTIVVTRKDTEVPIDYRMMKKGGRWVAYDIVIEGVSLVSNYRTQFNQIIQKSSYEDLVKGLKKKLDGRKPYAPKHHHRRG